MSKLNDILKPEVLWIEGRCYRLNNSNTEVTAFQEHDLYEDDIIFENMNDEGEDDNCEVTMIDSTRYSTSIHVSKHYVGSIIGKKGINKMRIERDTKTEIKIPKQSQTGEIVIFGPSPNNVKAAKRRIDIIVISSRSKQKPTHFISIPMNSEETMKKYENFKENVLRECPDRGLDESVFIGPNKLHLTLGVMCLMDNEERLQASKLLSEVKEKIILPTLESFLPLRIRVRGLQYMNDDPCNIHVLYGCVHEENAPSGLLQKLADDIVEYFYKAGFMNKEFGREHVKLHVTLINSKYRNSESSTNIAKGSGEEPQFRNQRPKESFDGSNILEKFLNYDFGVAEVTEVHLSQLHSTGADGYYQHTSAITCRKS